MRLKNAQLVLKIFLPPDFLILLHITAFKGRPKSPHKEVHIGSGMRNILFILLKNVSKTSVSL